MGETSGERHFTRWQLALEQKHARSLDASVGDVAMERCTATCSEFALQEQALGLAATELDEVLRDTLC